MGRADKEAEEPTTEAGLFFDGPCVLNLQQAVGFGFFGKLDLDITHLCQANGLAYASGINPVF